MRKIKEVLRLHYEQGRSNREISRSLKKSPGRNELQSASLQ